MSMTNSNTRPKPWELPNHDISADLGQESVPPPVSQQGTPSSTNPNIPPPTPSHNIYNDSAYRSTNFGMGAYNGMNSYGGMGAYGGMNSYGMGSYNGMGGMGSMYGNYNSYGNPAFGNTGVNGFGGVTESTMATFQLLENLIGAINGFAQMLESSYMATHNSFFTLISFAEELGRLREFMGSFFGLFGIIKLLKKVLKKKGNKITNSKDNKLLKEFKTFTNSPDGVPKKSKLAWKPLIFFFMGVFGFPYILNKVIQRINENQKRVIKRDMSQPIDPTKLEFARAIYDFIPENPKIELSLKKGDLMAIISKVDTFGRESNWWKARTKTGEVGYVPYNYIEIIKRRKQIENLQEDNNPETTPIAENTNPIQ